MSELPDGMYTRDFQINLLVHLAKDEALFQDNLSRLKIYDFEVPGCRLIYETLVGYYAKYHKLPDFETLMIELTRKRNNFDGLTQTSIPPEQMEVLEYAMIKIGTVKTLNSVYYRDQIPGYLRSVRVTQAFKEVGTGGSVDDLLNRMTKINSDIANSNDIVIDGITSNPELSCSYADIARIPTCLPKLNDFLAGGLGLKELGMIVAPTGLGKTTAQINFLHKAIHAGDRGLFLTLENPKRQIVERYMAIAAHVKIGIFDRPAEEWSKADKYRIGLLVDPTRNKWFGRESIVEAKRRFTIEDIDQTIARWRDSVYRQGGNPSECRIVFVDWLDQIEPTGLGVSNKDRDDTKLTTITAALAMLARKHNVAMWTATQATREGSGRTRLNIAHTAQAFHKNDSVDLALGLALADHGFKGIIGQDEHINKGRTECDRQLNASLMKIRRGNPGEAFEFYQGPTLKFWDSRQEALDTDKKLKNGELEEVIIHGR